MYDAPPKGVQPIWVSDRAKRAHDAIMVHYLAKTWEELRMGWVAIRLSDGGSDGILYGDKQSAVRAQLHEQQCAYVAFRGIGPAGSSPGELDRYLSFYEKAYDAGFRLADPDDPTGGPDILPTAARMDDFKSRIFPAMHAENLRQQNGQRPIIRGLDY